MTPDEIVRRAALLLRSGAVPVSEFVEALDDATRRKVRRTIAVLPETLQARENAARLAAGAVPCVRPGMKGKKVHAVVRRRGHSASWTACGAIGADNTCRTHHDRMSAPGWSARRLEEQFGISLEVVASYVVDMVREHSPSSIRTC